MPAVESQVERIEAAIQAKLAAIVGDAGVNYWYTPDKVVRATFTEDLLASSYSTVYVLDPSPSDTEEEEEEASHQVLGQIRLDLILCHRFDPPTEVPFRATGLVLERLQIQNRMIQDARKKLRTDISLGGLAENLNIVAAERGAENTWHERWAIAFLRLRVQHEYADTTP